MVNGKQTRGLKYTENVIPKVKLCDFKWKMPRLVWENCLYSSAENGEKSFYCLTAIDGSFTDNANDDGK